jgi:TonB-linked SusC/RagA family outer membrane protein
MQKHMDIRRKLKASGDIVSRTLLVLAFALTGQMLFAQGRQVTGTVQDSAGAPIIGASVIEQGTNNAAITGVDGRFALTVGPEAVLDVAILGYVSQAVTVAGRSNIVVTMAEEAQMVEDVVIVGYGAQRKESVVGAISQVSSRELLRSPAANVSQALAGKMAGVITSQTSGAPGDDDAMIFIRGRASFAGDGQPLILVDGVERPFSQIAPDDIESVSVLKDASATAVYGVRGANGVMIITTKRGSDQSPEVSLTANLQMQTPTRGDTYLNSYNSVNLLEEALRTDGLPSQFSQADIDKFRQASEGGLSGLDAILYPNVDWYDEVLRSYSPAQRYNASIRGGTRRMNYYVSGELFDQGGLIKNLSTDPYGNSSSPSFRRYAFRANLDLLLTKSLTLAVNFHTRFEERRGGSTSEDRRRSEIFYELNHTPGWLFPVSTDVQNGEKTETIYGGSSQYQNNIVGRLAKGGHHRQTNTINETNFILNYDLGWITQGLSARGMVSFDYQSMDRTNFMMDIATYELADRNNYNAIEAYTRFNADGEMNTTKRTNTDLKLGMEAQINYARRFSDVHDVTAMVNYNQENVRNQADLARRRQGVVGRVTYGYDDRYLAELNVGYNGSENFMEGRRFGFFPAFSLGWRLSEEAFMEKYKVWLNNLKLRASYGEVGNDRYEGQRFLFEEKWIQTQRDYYFGSSYVTGIYETQYPNYTVTWERAKKYNFGVDFGLWNGLLDGELDIFYESRSNILTNFLTRPMWVGVETAAGNLGKTTNQGFEITFRHANRIGRDFRYNVQMNFTHAANNIIFMDEPALMAAHRKKEGHPINQYYGLISDGFLTQADLSNPNLPISTFGRVQAGDLKYRDMNNDGYIDERDETAIGYSDIPENFYSVTLGGSWKKISFSVMFQGVGRVSRFYDAEAQFAFVDGGKVKEHHMNRWDPAKSESENLSNAKYPLLHYAGFGNHNQRANSFFLKNGAFLRLKNVELSYTLPTAWTERVGMSNVRVYVNGMNLVTWDHLGKLVDPESDGSNRYPIMKYYNMGLNINF